MNESVRATPFHVWGVGLLSLLWNAVGCFDYLATKLRLDFYMARFSDAQLDYFNGFPAWFSVFWALVVWSSILGSIGLLMRRRLAVGLFGVSLFGLVVTSIYSLFLSDGLEIMGSEGAAFSAVIFVVAVVLLFYARRMSARDVLR
jgi:hypothetical protein